jgi:serine-type D-Ala-D-Ala carboxypeptidase/endopeptidase (penicillin-binding protein 4)
MLSRRSSLTILRACHDARRLVIPCLLLLLALTFASGTAQARGPRALEKRIDAILDTPPANRGFWGIVVAELPGGKIRYARNASHLFQPASNLKLFTTAAALEDLGPDFTTLTTVESDSPPDAEGRVDNLYIVGRGDANFASSRVLPYAGPNTQKNPQLSLDAIADLSHQIAAHGVRRVTGNLIADDSYFVYNRYPPDWAVDDMAWGYGAPVTALVFNDNTLLLEALPAAAQGSKASVTLEPETDGYNVINHLMTAAPGSASDVELARAPGSNDLVVYGSVPAGGSENQETVAIQDPSRLIAELLRRDLAKQAIPVEGQIEVHHLSPEAAAEAAPPQAVHRDVLALHRSLPLRQDIELTDKVSQNLHADILLLQLGRKIEGQGSRESGLKALHAFANKIGIPADELDVVDGSGLSRQDLVAPRAIVALLVAMARSPRFQDYYGALPVAGIDGTLSDRFKGTPLAGRLHAKTGTIEHVNSLSGYMDLPGGRRIAISIIGNADPLRSSQAEAAIDRIALQIFRYYSKRHRRLF